MPIMKMSTKLVEVKNICKKIKETPLAKKFDWYKFYLYIFEDINEKWKLTSVLSLTEYRIVLTNLKTKMSVDLHFAILG